MSDPTPALYRAGAGEPVVLLHGGTGSWCHWRPVLADLVAEFRLLRGVGHIPMWDDPQLIVTTIVDWIAHRTRTRAPLG